VREPEALPARAAESEQEIATGFGLSTSDARRMIAQARVVGWRAWLSLYSSTTTLAILTATELGRMVPDGDPAKLLTATATLTALVGALLILARLLRLGFVANFISTPVLVGFKTGIGLVIVLDQVPKLLGIHIDKHGFFPDVASVVALAVSGSEAASCASTVAMASPASRTASLSPMHRMTPSPADSAASAFALTVASPSPRSCRPSP